MALGLLCSGYCPVAAIAEGRIFGLLAVAQPYFAIFFGSKSHAFPGLLLFAVFLVPGLFVLSVAEGLLAAEAACAPCVALAGFYLHGGWFALGGDW